MFLIHWVRVFFRFLFILCFEFFLISFVFLVSLNIKIFYLLITLYYIWLSSCFLKFLFLNFLFFLPKFHQKLFFLFVVKILEFLLILFFIDNHYNEGHNYLLLSLKIHFIFNNSLLYMNFYLFNLKVKFFLCLIFYFHYQ